MPSRRWRTRRTRRGQVCRRTPRNCPRRGPSAITLETNHGDIPLVLDRAQAPCTVQSLAFLAHQKYFDGTSCHRLTAYQTPPFALSVLQCGDPLGTGWGDPDTNGSQFFLVYEDSRLRPHYTVFGHVTEAGMQVLDEIAAGGIDPGTEGTPEDGMPASEVVIERAKSGR